MDNTQTAPLPEELLNIVYGLEYRPGWKFRVDQVVRGQGSTGLTFCVSTLGYNTYYPERGETYRVMHYFPVPPAAYNRESWLRWVLDRIVEVETHEACEFMQVNCFRPFAPNHGPGWDPYQVRELNTTEAAETTFRGERREGTQGFGT